MAEPKDIWDKLDIIFRAAVPISVGVMLLVWNSQRTTQQTAAAMTDIAVGILTEENEVEGDDPLRAWAIDVLQNPGNPPPLSSDAAKQLKLEGLPLINSYGYWKSTPLTDEEIQNFFEKNANPVVQQLLENLNQDQ